MFEGLDKVMYVGLGLIIFITIIATLTCSGILGVLVKL